MLIEKITSKVNAAAEINADYQPNSPQLSQEDLEQLYPATAASPAVESFVNLTDKSGSDKGYHSVPPPLTGNFIPRKPDLTFMDEIIKSENLDVTTVVTPCNVKTVEDKGVSNTVESNADRMNNTSAPIIKDWNSDDESEIDYTVRPSTEKIKSVKTVRETEVPKQIPRGNQRNWNNLMSQRLGSDFKMTNKACYVWHFVMKNSIINTNVNTVSVKHTTAKNRAVVSKGKRDNTVKASVCWVWKAKNSSASTTFNKFSYIDARGRSKSIMAWIPKRV
ncbi:hypothetical protein Tco_0452776 [Tanacetum coccineum]